MNNSLSIFARALATENLSFTFDAKADTASFDVKSRHLVLPVWDVSETVQTMLVAHEISHALWTPYEESEILLNEAEKQGFNRMLLQRVCNMVEDVRIEKLMKQKYPGTRRDFFLGYKEIAEKDMFKFSKMDMSKQGILNKLNLHFKWGVPGFITVPMNAEEMELASIVDGVTTFPEVVAVAKALYKHPDVQKMVKQYEQQMAKGDQQGAESTLQEMSPDDGDGIGKKDGKKYAANTICFTGLANVMDGIIPTSALIRDFERHFCHVAPDLAEYRAFVNESDAFVRQLAAQFDRRKAADEIRRERPKQTGLLNMDKLHQFRTHDDIFISKIIKQDGKNHGIVFLLDMSGSMSHSLKDCFLQVLQLVWFCEKVKIPFEVFGFTEVHPSHLESLGLKGNHNPTLKRDCPSAAMMGASKLINLASSRDDAAKRETLLSYLYDCLVKGVRSRPSLLHLGSTPTVEAVAIASQFMVDWVKAHNIQIPTIMVVTDGQPNGICVKDDASCSYYHAGQGNLTVMNEITGTAHRIELSQYPQLCMGNLALMTMLNGLRQSINARCVGMFVGDNTLCERDYLQFCASNAEKNDIYGKGHRFILQNAPRYKAAKEAYADGAIIVHPDTFPGYDSFFLVRTPKIVNNKDADTGGNFTKVKNAFVKTMGKRACSRVFLSRYVDIVAGQPVKSALDAIYNHPVA